MAGLFAGALAAFLISLIVTPFIKKIAFKIGAIDCPDPRKVHSRTMPRMGGLAVYLAFTLAILLFQPVSRPMIGLLLGGTIIMMVGLIDDIWDISPRVKLFGQLLAATVLVFFGIEVEFLTNPMGGIINLKDYSMWGFHLGLPLTVLWVVGVTNALNLVDGLDGLAGGLASIAAVTLAIVGWANDQMVIVVPAVILAAATIGFLRYNFFPAKIFMGDSGSQFLGFILAGLSVVGLTKGAAVISVFVPVLILGIPIFDTLFAIIRRYVNNQPIFQADKEHLHHRLLAIGFSHQQTVLVIYVISFLLGVSAVTLTFLSTAQALLVFLGIIIVVFVGADRIGILRSRAAHNQARRANYEENKHISG